MATDTLSPLADLRGVPLTDLDTDLIHDAVKRIIATGLGLVPVTAFNSAI